MNNHPSRQPLELTSPDYWDGLYVGDSDAAPLHVEGFRNFPLRKLVEKLESLPLTDSRVLEVGAGNSAVLTHLARKYRNPTQFSGLDYSHSGCEMLVRRAALEGVKIEILHQDLFQPDKSLLDRFDIIYSIGVVEHFQDLSCALKAKKQLLAPGGQILTVIPNMAGILGRLTRRYNHRIYDLHVPHDLESFLQGHASAGLEVRSSGYLCSTNFGILSSCFRGRDDRGWNTYLWLARLSNALWFIEDKLFELPHSRTFSPYLYAISRKPASRA